MEESPSVYGTFYGLLIIQKPLEYVFRIFHFLLRMRTPQKNFSRSQHENCMPIQFFLNSLAAKKSAVIDYQQSMIADL